MTTAPMGDRALRFTLPAGAARGSLLDALRRLPHVADVVLAEELGCVVATDGVAISALEDGVRAALLSSGAARSEQSTKVHTIDVVYDGEDLAEVAATAKMLPEAIIAAHSEREYTVAMLGFMPGFGYLRGLDPRLVLPRRSRPRPRVPARSVAIAAEYTGIYPFASPGGWHLLGRAVDFTAFGDRGATLAVGDRVRFVPSAPRQTAALSPSTPLAAPGGAFLEVTSAAGIGVLVDGGRPGHMHEGVPRGGALVRALLARANVAAGNAPGACAVEIAGTLGFTARGGAVVVGDDTGAATRLADEESLRVGTEGRTRVRYLAIAGGIDAPKILGGRGTLLVAGIGGLEGRVLRRCDRLVPASRDESDQAGVEVPSEGDLDEAIAILEGPDEVAGFAVDALYRETFRISTQSDRTGTRLDGLTAMFEAPDEEAKRPSAPMVPGAIELTPSGLIVMGPDHPTTGGYPVVAVVASHSLDALFARPLGAPLRFRPAG